MVRQLQKKMVEASNIHAEFIHSNPMRLLSHQFIELIIFLPKIRYLCYMTKIWVIHKINS